MTQDNNSLPPAAGATTGGSAVSDITGGSSGGSGSSSAFGAGSSYSDTSRPTGTVAAGGYRPSSESSLETRDYGAGAARYGSESGGYRPSHGDVTIKQSTRGKPSTAVVMGAALAGALTGAAIPFMFAGRKSADNGTIVLDERRGVGSDVEASAQSSSGTGGSAGRW